MSEVEQIVQQDQTNMSPKELLIHNIKEWVKLDGELLQLKSEIKERTVKQKILSNNLMDIMKQHKIDCFDINGGAIVYKKNKIKKAISGKTLLIALNAYYNDNPTLAEEITKHIMENREEQIKETVKRKINK